MKKKIITTLGIISISLFSLGVGVFAASDIRLFVNGKQANADIQVIDGNSYVPLRAVAELLGADVKWDGDARAININSGTPSTPVMQSAAKSFAVNVNVDSGPMKLNISKVTLDPAFKKDQFSKVANAVILDVTAENTSTDTVKWYPNQGTIVLNTKEQANGDLYNSDDVAGEFIGKVVKTGKIVFVVKSDLSQVNSISYLIKGPNDSSYTRLGEDKTTDIILK